LLYRENQGRGARGWIVHERFRRHVRFPFIPGVYRSSSRPTDSRVSELNILSLAFLSVSAGNYAIAILHLDHTQSLQLLARDLIISERELSPEPSLLLPPTILSSSALAPTEAPPSLVTVRPQPNGKKEPIPGGILVLGGRKIRFFEHSSAEWQEKHRERQQKLESQKKNADRSLEGNAKDKQKRREIKGRRAKAAVEWPWREVAAYVSHSCHQKLSDRPQMVSCK
jgi:DNA damage-binding protein 1